MRNPTIGMLAGSFDPITKGHIELIRRAVGLVGKLFVVIAINPNKKYLLTEQERIDLVLHELQDTFLPQVLDKIEVLFMSGELLVHFGQKCGVTHLIRGIRNAQDLIYEEDMRMFNEDIDPIMQTVYLALPPDQARCSSSLVRGIVGTDRWETTLVKYVGSQTIEVLKQFVPVKPSKVVKKHCTACTQLLAFCLCSM